MFFMMLIYYILFDNPRSLIWPHLSVGGVILFYATIYFDHYMQKLWSFMKSVQAIKLRLYILPPSQSTWYFLFKIMISEWISSEGGE